MAERIRFHLDEHIDLDIARALRRQGINVTTTGDAGLRTKSVLVKMMAEKAGRR